MSWLPVVAWATLIFVLSAQPNLRFVEDSGLDFVVRKIGHMAVFGVLALLLWRALAGTTASPRQWALAFGLTVLYAISDEVHQAVVSGRHASIVDVGIDAAGALIALVSAAVLRRGPGCPGDVRTLTCIGAGDRVVVGKSAVTRGGSRGVT